MTMNKQWIYASKPNAQVSPANFNLQEAAMPQPKEGEVLVLSLIHI